MSPSLISGGNVPWMVQGFLNFVHSVNDHENPTGIGFMVIQK